MSPESQLEKFESQEIKDIMGIDSEKDETEELEKATLGEEFGENEKMSRLDRMNSIYKIGEGADFDAKGEYKKSSFNNVQKWGNSKNEKISSTRDTNAERSR